MSRTFRHRHLPRQHAWGGSHNYVDSRCRQYRYADDEKIWYYLAHEANAFPCTISLKHSRHYYRNSHGNCIPGSYNINYFGMSVGVCDGIRAQFDAIRSTHLYAVGSWHPYATLTGLHSAKREGRITANRSMRRHTVEICEDFRRSHAAGVDWLDYDDRWPHYNEYFSWWDLD